MARTRATYGLSRFSVRAALLLVILCGLGFGIVIPPLREKRHQVECAANLTKIGLAMHAYHEAYGCFPPAFVADTRGRPMHSWRVLILPFAGERALYEAYRFDEPWDGPNNRHLPRRHWG